MSSRPIRNFERARKKRKRPPLDPAQPRLGRDASPYPGIPQVCLPTNPTLLLTVSLNRNRKPHPSMVGFYLPRNLTQTAYCLASSVLKIHELGSEGAKDSTLVHRPKFVQTPSVTQGVTRFRMSRKKRVSTWSDLRNRVLTRLLIPQRPSLESLEPMERCDGGQGGRRNQARRRETLKSWPPTRA